MWFRKTLDQRSMRFNGWETLMVSYHPAKFGGSGVEALWLWRYAFSGWWAIFDMPSIRTAITVSICHTMLTHKIAGFGHNNLLVCPIKGSQSWSHMSARTTDGIYWKKIASPSKHSAKKQEKKKWRLQSF